MILQIATAAWFCFNVGVCYDQANVAVAGDQVATMLTDGQRLVGLIVDCKAKTHWVLSGKDSVEGKFESTSVADYICQRHLAAN